MFRTALILSALLGGPALAQDAPESEAPPASEEAPEGEEQFKDGFNAGVLDARANSTRRTFTAGVGAGAVISGAGVLGCGVLGASFIGAGCVTPGLVGYYRPGAPTPGPWMDEDEAFRTGYEAGWVDVTRRRKTIAAVAGGALGAGIGTAVGVTGLMLLAGATDTYDVSPF